jgi:uncharacterized membrane protein
MRTRSSYVRERLRTSYWVLPALMVLGAALLAFIALTIDDHSHIERFRPLRPFVFSGGPDGAREVLATIAASMITVAGVVFSVTVVSLQLASTQFGPRMLANFMRDRANQATLGTFLAAFLYSLIVLRTIRTDSASSVPHLSVTLGLGLAIAGLSVLIFFIHHIATSIQAPSLVESIASDLDRRADSIFPDLDQVPNAQPGRVEDDLAEDFDDRSAEVMARSTGYVQVIDLERLVTLAREHDLRIRLAVRPGRFVVHQTAFAHAAPADRVTAEVRTAIAATVAAGSSRASVQDVEYLIRQLVELSVRALSPSLNDPFTASTCVDQLGAALCRIADQELPPTSIADEDGTVRVAIGDPVTFPRLVGVAFDQIRQMAGPHVPVYAHLLESLTRVSRRVTEPGRLEPLARQGQLVMEAAERRVELPEDLASIEERYDALLGVVAAPAS